MICVIADDLSGAAEIGGAAWQAGLSAVVAFDRPALSDAEVQIVDTDSRSCSPQEAAARVTAAWNHFADTSPAWVYKKVDSVLRGNVLAELRGLLSAGNFARAVLLPSNPRRGRMIRDGGYFVDGRPLHQTVFARDPEYPARHHRVLDLLGRDASRTCAVARQPSETAAGGITVAEVQSREQLRQWAIALQPDTLAAGAVEFFEVLLDERSAGGPPPSPPQIDARFHSCLFVCGSPTAWQTKRRQQVVERNLPLASVLADTPPPAAGRLARQVESWLETRGCAMIAFTDDRRGSPRELLVPCVDLATRVVQAGTVGRCFVEGGATASALLRNLHLQQLQVQRQYLSGVVGLVSPVMKTEFVIKPGSYDWPESFWPGG